VFDHIAEIMDHFTEALGLSRYTQQDEFGCRGLKQVCTYPLTKNPEERNFLKWPHPRFLLDLHIWKMKIDLGPKFLLIARSARLA